MALPKLFLEVIGVSASASAMLRGLGRDVEVASETTGTASKKMSAITNAAFLGVAAAATYVGAKTVEMAGNFQQQMTRVKTGAGEFQNNMATVTSGVLQMAGQVGQSTEQLTSGLYLIESAGYHGTDALNVLRTAAMGAKVGNADLGTTADALTTVMKAYASSNITAAQGMNALIATEGQGKTNLEALAASMSTVLPIAAAAHVKLNEVLGAMATMTAEGTPAADAATYLKQTIGQLSHASGPAAQEMQSLGLSAVAVSQNLGKNGLASTLTMLTDAIEKKMGPAGLVLIDHLKKAASNTTAFQQVLAKLPPAQQTYVGALASMVGGTKSMQAALELTGDHMKDFQDNVDVINQKVKNGGTTIEGWADVQKNFNQKVAEAKGTLEALGITIGQKLLPYVGRAVGDFTSLVGWFERHKTVSKELGIALLAITGALTAYKTITLAVTAATKAWAAIQVVLDAAMDANPVGLIILAIAALVAIVIEVALHWKTVWGFVKRVGEDIGHWFAHDFAGFFVHLWDQIWGFLVNVGHWFRDKWNESINAGKEALAWLEALPGRIWDGLKALPSVLERAAVEGMHRLMFAIGYGIGLAVKALIEWPPRAVRAVDQFFVDSYHRLIAGYHMVINFFKGLGDDAVALVQLWWRTTVDNVQAGIDFAVRWVSTMPGKILKFFEDLWNGSVQWGARMVRDVTAFLASLPDKGRDAVATLPGKILDALKDAGQWLYNTGRDIIQGLLNGASGMIQSAINTVKGWGHDIWNGFKSAIDAHSPSRKFMQSGADIVAGLVQGINDNAHHAVNAVSGLGAGLSLGNTGLGFAGSGVLGSRIQVEACFDLYIDGTQIRDVVIKQSQRYKGRNSTTALA